MEELFTERLTAARANGRAAVAAVWARAAADLLHARVRGWRPERVPLTVYIDERTTLMIGSDLRYAWRALVRQRGASALVVLMLALGIAANVAVFSLVNGLFLRPFPFPQPDRLAYINTAAPKWNLDVVGINFPDFYQWNKDQKLFDALMHYDFNAFNLSDGGGATRVAARLITGDFTKVLGVEPILGRTFTADEDRPKGPPVVILSTALWRDRFGGDRERRRPHRAARRHRPDDRRRHAAEASFPERGPALGADGGRSRADVSELLGRRHRRMKPGVTIEQAQADIRRAHQPIWDSHARRITSSRRS
jgi:hypothetical protein